jgi:serine/threonine-protein kinase HipA
MTISPTTPYQVTDQLFLWWLANPAQPVLIGELNTARAQRGVSLRYDNTWIEHGFALSEDLPLLAGQEFFPLDKDCAAGAVDDARPDRWGERVIRFLDKPPRLSLMEYLYFAGDERFGALGVSTSRSRYLPRPLGPLPQLADAQAIQALVRKVAEGEPIDAHERRLIAPGVTLGGARPKALIMLDGAQWVVKFADGEPTDTPLVEHASMTLAEKAGIVVAQTMPIRLIDGHAVAVKRFDRGFDRDGSRRLHALSANVALKAAGEQLGYPQLAQLLRRRGVVEGGAQDTQRAELFRRMVFNILIDNTDDHEKNHALLVTDAQQYELSPAYDVLPSGQALGYQQMIVGRDAADSTLENALSMCAQFGLSKSRAVDEAAHVAQVVNTWQHHFADCGVTARDIAAYAEQIDRPFLREQREEFARRV